jgi:aspartate/methionine/tyrosine aminotransferase
MLRKEIDPLTEVVVTAGGVNALSAAFGGTLNAGDEVILVEPFYDCYLPQLELAGAKAVGVPLRPSPACSKEDIKAGKVTDQWRLDFPLL